jgi:hypothetical protein
VSDPNSTPAGTGHRQPDATHGRGETNDRNQRTPRAKDPVAHGLPGAVPGNTGIDDVGARMIPRSNAAGETGPEGKTTEGVSGAAGVPGGSAPREVGREERGV